jgi:Ice-binding-like
MNGIYSTFARWLPVAALGLTIVVPTSSGHAQAPDLGTVLPSFAVLGATTVTNTGSSVLAGNLGVSPGTSIIGFPPGTNPGFQQYTATAQAAQAQTALTTAILALAGTGVTQNLTGDLGGRTLGPGVYGFSSTAQLTGPLTLTGSANDVFIFKIGSTLTTASRSSVVLAGGAQAGNVFWDVGSSATLGTFTSFQGDILANASITLTTGATIICGAAWASTAAVTLDSNTISIPTAASCPAAATAAAAAAAATAAATAATNAAAAAAAATAANTAAAAAAANAAAAAATAAAAAANTAAAVATAAAAATAANTAAAAAAAATAATAAAAAAATAATAAAATAATAAATATTAAAAATAAAASTAAATTATAAAAT